MHIKTAKGWQPLVLVTCNPDQWEREAAAKAAWVNSGPQAWRAWYRRMREGVGRPGFERLTAFHAANKVEGV